MGFFSSISSILGNSSREKERKEPNIAAENEQAYKEAKRAFDHFFDDEKSVEIQVDTDEDNG